MIVHGCSSSHRRPLAQLATVRCRPAVESAQPSASCTSLWASQPPLRAPSCLQCARPHVRAPNARHLVSTKRGASSFRSQCNTPRACACPRAPSLADTATIVVGRRCAGKCLGGATRAQACTRFVPGDAVVATALSRLYRGFRTPGPAPEVVGFSHVGIVAC